MVIFGKKKETRIALKIIKWIFSPLNFSFNKILKSINFFIIWRSGIAIGDQVLITGFAKLLKSTGNKMIFMLKKYKLSTFIT